MASRVGLVGIAFLLLAASCAGDGSERVTADVTDPIMASPSADKTVEETPPVLPVTTKARPSVSAQPSYDGRSAAEFFAATPPRDQMDLVDQLTFELEVAKEDNRSGEAYVESHKYVALTGSLTICEERLNQLAKEVARADPQITDAALRARFQSDVIDVLHEMQKAYAARHSR